MIDLLTKPEGLVTVTDAADKDHQLPSMLQLIADVSGLTNDLSGAVAQVREISSQTLALSNDARASADSAASSAADAQTSVSNLGKAVGDAANSASAASTSAGLAAASEVAASKSADAADASKLAAAVSESMAQGYMNTAGMSAEAARGYRDDAQLARDMSSSYANAPVNMQVTPGQYSAFHWAEQARLIAVGAVVYKGSWDASGSTMPPSPKLGDFYFISKAGTVSGVKWASGDMAVFDGTLWERIDNQQTVTSVAGRTGAIALTIADIAALQTALDSKQTRGALQSVVSQGAGSSVLYRDAADAVTRFGVIFGDNTFNLCSYDDTGGYRASRIAMPRDSASPVLIDGQKVWTAGNFDPATKQGALGYNPVQQGTGVGQGTNVVKIGYASGGTGKIKCTIDVTDFGNIAMESWVTANYLPNTGGNVNGTISLQNQSTERQIQWVFGGRTTYLYGNPSSGDIGLYDTVAGTRWRTDTGNNFYSGASIVSGSGYFQTSQTHCVIGNNGAAGIIYFRPNGTGNSSGEATVRSNGDMYVTAWVYGSNFKLNSDQRLKSKAVLLNARTELDRIKRLIPRRYVKAGKAEYGFFAQELKKEYPSMVSVGEGPAGPDTHTISQMELIAPIVAVLQDFDRRLSEAGL